MRDQLDAGAVIDRAPIGTYQVAIVTVCALIALVDGLDIQALAIATPHLARAWGVAPAAFGPVLSASFAGIMLGTMLLGMLGDRLGRRRILIVAFPLVGAASLATAVATDLWQLGILRFVTGFLIGGCLPNATAITAEVMPARRTKLAITLMYSAVPLGGVLGSAIAPPLIAALGWRGIFLLGGVAPFAILPLLFFVVPESVRFLLVKQRREAAARVLHRLAPATFPRDGDLALPSPATGDAAGGVAVLFAPSRALLTVALWVTFFASMAAMYLLTSWLPILFMSQGWERGEAIRTLAWFQLGGVVGGVFGGWLSDRFAPMSALVLLFSIAAVALLGLGFLEPSLASTTALVVSGGFGLVGAQLCLTAFCGAVYPTLIRSTGVGWALGVGRLGAVLSPLAGGAAMKAGWSAETIFVTAALLPIACAAILATTGRIAHGSSREAPAP